MVIHDHKRIKTWNVKSGCSVEHSIILWAVLGSATRFCPSNLPLSPPYMFFQILQMTFMCSTCFDAGDPLHSLVRACDHGSEVAQTPSSFSISASSESIFPSSSSCSPDGLGSRLAEFWWQGIFSYVPSPAVGKHLRRTPRVQKRCWGYWTTVARVIRFCFSLGWFKGKSMGNHVACHFMCKTIS